MSSLRDRKIIVTAGPTREWVDPVRYLTNPSSGRMGLALALAATIYSDSVVLVHGHMEESLVCQFPGPRREIETTGDLLRSVLNELEPKSVLIMAAAPADYTPVSPFSTKIKKGADTLTVEFRRTPDILKEVAEREIPGIHVTGFAAETNDLREGALKKLREKKLDMICLNDVTSEGCGFSVTTNDLIIFKKDGTELPLGMMSKEGAARKVLSFIAEDLEEE
jgi:phosphopantothenoylcysteine decarboxylase/phosphopantothenate--cysteine ligase